MPLLRDALRRYLGTSQLAGRLADLHTALDVLGSITADNVRHLSRLEILMTELDSTTDDVVTVLDQLVAAVGETPQQLADALAEIGRLNGEIADLQSDDNADAAAIADLTSQRDALVADATENVSKLQAAAERGKAAIPTPADETTDPAAPVEEPAPPVAPAEDPAPLPTDEPGNPVAQDETGSDDGRPASA